MSYLDTNEDREPTLEELDKIARLSPEQLEAIDELLLSVATKRFKKVAFIVGTVKSRQDDFILHFPDTFFSRRIALLVNEGYLEAQGDLKRMRYSEVKLTMKQFER